MLNEDKATFIENFKGKSREALNMSLQKMPQEGEAQDDTQKIIIFFPDIDKLN